MKTYIFYVVVFITTITYSQVDKNAKAELNNSALAFLSTQEKNFNKAKTLYENKDYENALKIALKIVDEIKQPTKLKGETLLLIGAIFRENNNFNRAIIYLEKANKILLNYKNQLLTSKSTQLLAATYLQNYIADTTKITALNKSLKFYNKIIELDDDDTQMLLKVKAKSYAGLSSVFFIKKNFLKSKKYADNAITSFIKLKDTMSTVIALNNLANNYWTTKKYNKAKQYYSEALALLINKKDEEGIKFKEALYENLAYVMNDLKDYRGFTYLDKSFKIRDSLREVEIRTILAGIDAEFNAERIKKEEEIKRLSETREKERSQRLNSILLSAFILSIIGALLLYRYMSLRKEKVELKMNQNILLQQKEVDRILQESQTKIINATLDGKEQERQEIAEILHDSVSALLSSANLHLQASKSQLQEPIPEEITKTQNILAEASKKIRNLSHDILSSVLLKFGLSYAIQDLCDKYSNSEIQFEYKGENIKRYNQKFEIKINSIIEELINNIIKHSKASKALINLKEDESSLELTIQDNGVGFDVDMLKTKDNSGIGLSQIEARVKIMKGILEFNSNKVTGTKVFLKVPIKYKTPFDS